MMEQRILLLEDEPEIADLLALVLGADGYEVDLASTVAQARGRLAERPYGLVIADSRLPDGDGIAIADRAAELGAKTAVMSGYAMSAGEAARHEVWAKPMRPSEFTAAVERCIGRIPAKS